MQAFGRTFLSNININTFLTTTTTTLHTDLVSPSSFSRSLERSWWPESEEWVIYSDLFGGLFIPHSNDPFRHRGSIFLGTYLEHMKLNWVHGNSGIVLQLDWWLSWRWGARGRLARSFGWQRLPSSTPPGPSGSVLEGLASGATLAAS